MKALQETPVDPKNCTGCQTCRLVCPKKAITIAFDSEGFQMPQIDQSLCVRCGLCESKCPQKQPLAFRGSACVKAYGARLKDDKLLSKSASGGVFAGMAARWLSAPGSAVFGSAFDSDIVAKQRKASSMSEAASMQGSKYVQSDTGDSFLETKEFLEAGNAVLYSGTPCQIAGLYAFLGKDYEKLLTIDLVCHGTPSPLLFKRYLEWMEKKHGGKIVGYGFRVKDKAGWDMGCYARTEAKEIYPFHMTDPYFNGFLVNATLRECCFSCKQAKPERVSDLTICDYWGVEAEHPEKYDKRGVSAVMANTEKGKQAFDAQLGDYDCFDTTYEKIEKHNGCLVSPSTRSPHRDRAFRHMPEPGFAVIDDLISLMPPFKRRLLDFLYSMPFDAISLARGCKKR
ncbi:MAG: Coenzyme F420 hydrogenase/dehydrogenase, beta subunit C-terminal domain [Clostridiales bacterium]|jgi:coenzyme F420-reducing hydrogenase beta subunit|nr:Coenzyme F420 hydrogenase/dehydrogenase, beta subunit C-terminal domain [Clostridiales bacterium]